MISKRINNQNKIKKNKIKKKMKIIMLQRYNNNNKILKKIKNIFIKKIN